MKNLPDKIIDKLIVAKKFNYSGTIPMCVKGVGRTYPEYGMLYDNGGYMFWSGLTQILVLEVYNTIKNETTVTGTILIGLNLIDLKLVTIFGHASLDFNKNFEVIENKNKFRILCP
jgi:hypothetical protein